MVLQNRDDVVYHRGFAVARPGLRFLNGMNDLSRHGILIARGGLPDRDDLVSEAYTVSGEPQKLASPHSGHHKCSVNIGHNLKPSRAFMKRSCSSWDRKRICGLVCLGISTLFTGLRIIIPLVAAWSKASCSIFHIFWMYAVK